MLGRLKEASPFLTRSFQSRHAALSLSLGSFNYRYTARSSARSSPKFSSLSARKTSYIGKRYAEIARSPSLSRFARSVGSLAPFPHNVFGNNSGSASVARLRSRLRITRNTRNCLSVFLRFAPKSLRQLCLFRSRYMTYFGGNLKKFKNFYSL